jgi:hypothetical protein
MFKASAKNKTNENPAGESAFNQDISSWRTVNATILSGMFENNKVFVQDVSKWSIKKVTSRNMEKVFANSAFVESRFRAKLTRQLGWHEVAFVEEMTFSTFIYSKLFGCFGDMGDAVTV